MAVLILCCQETGRQTDSMLLLTFGQEELNNYNLMVGIERNIKLEVDEISLKEKNDHRNHTTFFTSAHTNTHTHTHTHAHKHTNTHMHTHSVGHCGKKPLLVTGIYRECVNESHLHIVCKTPGKNNTMQKIARQICINWI